MNPVKNVLQYIVSGKINDKKEAKKMYLDNVYENEQKIRKSDNKIDRKNDMIEIYDQGRIFFLFL